MCKSSNINERELLNKLQSIDCNEIIKNPQNINEKTNVQNLLRHIKIFNEYVMAFESSRTSQRNQIFNMINFMGTPSFFFTLNPAFFHHLLIVVLIGQKINVDLFYDDNMLNKNEQCRQTTINPKAQAIFVHILVNVIFKYMLQV